MKTTKIQSVKVVACTHNGKLNGHIVPRHLKNKGRTGDTWDVEGRLIKDADFKKLAKASRTLERIVKYRYGSPNWSELVLMEIEAARPPCLARKLLARKETK